ncbi:uncharacterized protein LOC143879823 isoform X2 [Tasmannia lanceolata]|uniref:uncharacterized protein LOC143879823 isoform X2 n=1 Tax=Tasmannia lanceolata TaxID=3420 RepID=UPI0040648697
MGSSNSKGCSSDGVRVRRSTGVRVFQPSCLGGSSGTQADDDLDCGPQNKDGNLGGEPCPAQMGTKSDLVNGQYRGKVRVLQSNQVTSISSNTNFDEQVQENATHNESGTSSSSTQTMVARSLNPLSRSRSCFNFIPDHISFRLSRAASLGSSGSCSVFSTSLPISNSEEDFHSHTASDSLDGRANLSPLPQYRELSSRALQLDPQTSGISVHLQNEDIVSSQEMPRSNSSTRTGSAVNRYSHRNHRERANIERRHSDRLIGAQEPVEGGVRFSRALSVGRLRDRVLCRTSFSDGLLGHLQQDRLYGDIGLSNGRRLWGAVTRTTSDGNTGMLPTSSSYHLPSTSSSTNSSQDYEVETPQLRETSNHALVEHRTAFLERRRRMRSQVRALQRLGSRFENFSGHDRSCILSGQHRTGRCMCRANSQASNPDEDTSTRASISRIVMLAEALFEQSVVLSSRPSVSSIGSVPAPKEVVECMPIKIYSKPRKLQNEEIAQCYICLVEYEDGDCMRILPCHHDFHRTCIDKWLKEIHRVCPLCRGDVCKSELSSSEKFS